MDLSNRRGGESDDFDRDSPANYLNILSDQKELLNELNSPEMQSIRLKASVEYFFADLRRSLDESEGNGVLKVYGTEAATLGVYLRDAKDTEDLSRRCLEVWAIFYDALESDREVANKCPEAADYFAGSIINHSAFSIVNVKCNEHLVRLNLDAGMEVGKFLKKVNDQGVRLEYLPGDANTPLDQRNLESATIKRNLKSLGEEIIGTLFSEYQKYESNFTNLLDDALNEVLLNKYCPPFVTLSDEGVDQVRRFCIQECGSLYERDLSESLQGRINQVFDALLRVGAIEKGEMLYPRSPQ